MHDVMPPPMSIKVLRHMIAGLGILVVDDNSHMRKVTRMMLTNLGAKSVFEAADGMSALETIRSADPDVMVLDWEMPALSGSDVMRLLRSPEVSPKPALPVIVLTAFPQRRCVTEAIALGAHEFLVKPTSPKALHDRLLSIIAKPRPMVKVGPYYVPLPRDPLARKNLLGRTAKA
jgi:CheY-like chemotaxis protein